MDELQQNINHWHKSAKDNWTIAKDLLKLKHYDACLFFCHLAIEKLLKGLVLRKTKQAPPFIHHLERLAYLANIELSDQQKQDFKTILDFNIAGRYNNIKLNFYKQCTKTYTEKNFKMSKQIYLWLEKQYHNLSDKKSKNTSKS